MTPFQRLVARLRREGVDLPDHLTLRRTRAGYWQRAAGAWSWYAVDERGQEVIASHYAVRVLLRADGLRVEVPWQGSVPEVDPVDL